VALGAAAPAFADKTDIVEMRNGDRITGEIKKLDRGQLSLSTSSMGTISIEWQDIDRVTSKELYVIELQDGSRIDGRLGATADGGQLVVTYGDATRTVPMDDIIWIDPLKLDGSRFKRWDGSISAGFDATKANNDSSLSVAFSARRRAEAFRIDLDSSVYSRSQDGAEDSLRASFGGAYRRLLPERWFWAAVGTAERNDELGIDLRTLGGGGFGRYLVQTGRSLWSVTGGSVLVNEQRAGGESGETNVEGFFSTAFEFFTYDTPKTSLTTTLSVFPSITDAGRVRGNLDIALRQELVKDLFFDLSFYQSYDSEPPEEGQTSDYGIVTSLGYSF
jgi:putative salt-induced outer membrane protein YdiY